MSKATIKQRSGIGLPLKLAFGALGATVIVFAIAQLLPNMSKNADNNPIGNNLPFSPKTVSAAELSKLSEKQITDIKSGKVPLYISKETVTSGPQFERCDQGGIGPEANGGGITTYVFHSKDSGKSALYITNRDSNKTFMYYGQDAESLGSTLDGLLQSRFTLDENSEQIDRNLQPTNAQLSSSKENGREVFHLYARAKGQNDTCDNQQVLREYIVDANTNLLISTKRYVGSFDQSNLITSYRHDLQLRNISEEQAIDIMSKDGFEKDKAVDTIPGQINIY